jgi:AraC-like DNA-binding protein
MKITHRRPAAPLRTIIDRYWSWESEHDTPLPLLPMMPSPGGMEIFFHFDGGFSQLAENSAPRPLPLAHTACVRSRPIALAQTGRTGFIAVRVRAGAITRLTRLPASVLSDAFLAAADIWGNDARILAERLADATTLDERITLLDAFFLMPLRHTRHDHDFHAPIASLLHRPQSITELARQTGLGTRQLEKRFLALTGTSPARFRRLARLRRSIRSLLLAPLQTPLTSLLDPAYFDQPQQIREFREFTGLSPGELREAAARSSHFYNRPWQT